MDDFAQRHVDQENPLGGHHHPPPAASESGLAPGSHTHSATAQPSPYTPSTTHPSINQLPVVVIPSRSIFSRAIANTAGASISSSQGTTSQEKPQQQHPRSQRMTQLQKKPVTTRPPVQTSASVDNKPIQPFDAKEFKASRGGGRRKDVDLATVHRYRLNPTVQTVMDVLQEWRYGFQGGPAIQDLNSDYDNQWRDPLDSVMYQQRLKIVQEFIRLATGAQYSNESAIQYLVDLQGSSRSIDTLSEHIKNARPTTATTSTTSSSPKKRPSSKTSTESSPNVEPAKSNHDSTGLDNTVGRTQERRHSATPSVIASKPAPPAPPAADALAITPWAQPIDPALQFDAREFELVDPKKRPKKLDPESVTHYSLNPKAHTVPEVLQEWRYGLQDGPAIQDLYAKYGNKWRDPADISEFNRRSLVVNEYVRLVTQVHYSDLEAIQHLERMRNGYALSSLCTQIREARLRPDSPPKSSLKPRNYSVPVPFTPLAGDVPIKTIELTSDPRYHLSSEVKTVRDTLQEWQRGFQRGPAIKDLNEQFGGVWKDPADATQYSIRFRIVQEYDRLVELGRTHDQAIQELEELRGEGSLRSLYDTIRDPSRKTKLIASEFLTHPSRVAEDSLIVDWSKMPEYYLNDSVKSVVEVLLEWRHGFKDGPAIQDLDRLYGIHWRKPEDTFKYRARLEVVQQFVRLVDQGLREKRAIKDLEERRGGRPLATFLQQRLSSYEKRDRGGDINADADEPDLDPQLFMNDFGGAQGEHPTLDTPTNPVGQDQLPTKAREFRRILHRFKAAEFVLKVARPRILTAEDLRTISQHTLSDEVETVPEVLQEWRFGFKGGLAIQDLNVKYGTQWRESQASMYKPRLAIVEEYVRLVTDEQYTDTRAILYLERLQGVMPLNTMPRLIKQSRPDYRPRIGASKQSTNITEKDGGDFGETDGDDESEEEEEEVMTLQEQGHEEEEGRSFAPEFSEDEMDGDQGLVDSGNTGSGDEDDDLGEYPQFKAREFCFQKSWKDPSNNVPIYCLNNAVKTVPEVLREWRFGFRGGPAIQDLNATYANRWRMKRDQKKYEVRRIIVKEYVRLVQDKRHKNDDVIQTLESLRGEDSLRELYHTILEFRVAEKEEERQQQEEEEKERKRLAVTDQDLTQENDSDSGVDVDADSETASESDVDAGANTTTSSLKRKQRPLTILRDPKRLRAYASIDSDEEENNGEEREGVDEEEDDDENAEVDDGFPLPVRKLCSVRHVWKEWHEGWDGEPSLKALIEIHGKVWNDDQYSKKYRTFFYQKERFVNLVRMAVKTRRAKSVTQAIHTLRTVQSDNQTFSGFMRSSAFKKIRDQWNRNVVN
ncbi:hypothetical protein BGZ83_010669 [Gryganskiella cystojenkinii]|nr:hypothetical protein BGZ83_010669 [Gryganskiella cystojenkinii]